MTSSLMAVQFDAPLLNPAPNGLWNAVAWQPQDGPLRWLQGVDIRPFNFGADESFAVWTPGWCGSVDDLDPEDRKDIGERPDALDTFAALTVFAHDQCDMTARSRAEVRTRAEQILRLNEGLALETALAARMLDDAGTPDTATDVVGAVGWLEAKLARTNTVGVIHASAQWAASLAQANLIVRGGAGLRTPMGHQLVLGGGYVDGLVDTLVATSAAFGWRGEAQVYEAPKLQWNQAHAIAERSMVVGYEALVGAVTITG